MGYSLGWNNPLILTIDPNLLGHPRTCSARTAAILGKSFTLTNVAHERKEGRKEWKEVKKVQKRRQRCGTSWVFPIPIFRLSDWGFQFLSPVFSVAASPTFPVYIYIFGSRLLLRLVITTSHGVRCGWHVLGILGWRPQRQPQHRGGGALDFRLDESCERVRPAKSKCVLGRLTCTFCAKRCSDNITGLSVRRARSDERAVSRRAPPNVPRAKSPELETPAAK